MTIRSSQLLREESGRNKKSVKFSKFARMCGVVLGLSTLTTHAVAAQSSTDDLGLGLAALESRDFPAASQFFADAFKNAQPDGAFYLGRMLELGLGSEPDAQAAIALYIAGSSNGSAPSKNRLGVLHMDGKGVLQDFERGASLICEAAELGDPNGAYNCANLLLEGKGVEQDEVKAYEWFKKSADLGHIGAKNLYATALLMGTHVEQDHPGAIALFEETAAEGNPFGLFSLGRAYALGVGIEQDPIKAHAYLNLAATLNYPLAADARALVEQNMSDDDIRQAQQFAKSWKPNATGEIAQTVLDEPSGAETK